jgi:hypothetical protein
MIPFDIWVQVTRVARVQCRSAKRYVREDVLGTVLAKVVQSRK